MDDRGDSGDSSSGDDAWQQGRWCWRRRSSGSSRLCKDIQSFPVRKFRKTSMAEEEGFHCVRLAAVVKGGIEGHASLSRPIKATCKARVLTLESSTRAENCDAPPAYPAVIKTGEVRWWGRLWKAWWSLYGLDLGFNTMLTIETSNSKLDS